MSHSTDIIYIKQEDTVILDFGEEVELNFIEDPANFEVFIKEYYGENFNQYSSDYFYSDLIKITDSSSDGVFEVKINHDVFGDYQSERTVLLKYKADLDNFPPPEGLSKDKNFLFQQIPVKPSSLGTFTVKKGDTFSTALTLTSYGKNVNPVPISMSPNSVRLEKFSNNSVTNIPLTSNDWKHIVAPGSPEMFLTIPTLFNEEGVFKFRLNPSNGYPFDPIEFYVKVEEESQISLVNNIGPLTIYSGRTPRINLQMTVQGVPYSTNPITAFHIQAVLFEGTERTEVPLATWNWIRSSTDTNGFYYLNFPVPVGGSSDEYSLNNPVIYLYPSASSPVQFDTVRIQLTLINDYHYTILNLPDSIDNLDAKLDFIQGPGFDILEHSLSMQASQLKDTTQETYLGTFELDSNPEFQVSFESLDLPTYGYVTEAYLLENPSYKVDISLQPHYDNENVFKVQVPEIFKEIGDHTLRLEKQNEVLKISYSSQLLGGAIIDSGEHTLPDDTVIRYALTVNYLWSEVVSESRGTIIASKDPSWSHSVRATTVSFYQNHCVIGFREGRILLGEYSDGEWSWVDISDTGNIYNDWIKIFLVDENTFYGATEYNIIKWERSSGFSKLEDPNLSMNFLSFLVKDEFLYATCIDWSSNSSKVIRSKDEGVSWEEILNDTDISPFPGALEYRIPQIQALNSEIVILQSNILPDYEVKNLVYIWDENYEEWNQLYDPELDSREIFSISKAKEWVHINTEGSILRYEGDHQVNLLVKDPKYSFVSSNEVSAITSRGSIDTSASLAGDLLLTTSKVTQNLNLRFQVITPKISEINLGQVAKDTENKFLIHLPTKTEVDIHSDYSEKVNLFPFINGNDDFNGSVEVESYNGINAVVKIDSGSELGDLFILAEPTPLWSLAKQSVLDFEKLQQLVIPEFFNVWTPFNWGYAISDSVFAFTKDSLVWEEVSGTPARLFDNTTYHGISQDSTWLSLVGAQASTMTTVWWVWDYDSSWTEVSALPNFSNDLIYSVSATPWGVYASGDNGKIWHYDGTDVIVKQIEDDHQVPDSSTISSILHFRSSEFFLLAQDYSPRILKYDFDSNIYTEISVPFYNPKGFLKVSNYLVVYNDLGIYLYNDYNNTWRLVAEMDPYSAISQVTSIGGDSSGRTYLLVATHSGIYRIKIMDYGTISIEIPVKEIESGFDIISRGVARATYGGNLPYVRSSDYPLDFETKHLRLRIVSDVEGMIKDILGLAGQNNYELTDIVNDVNFPDKLSSATVNIYEDDTMTDLRKSVQVQVSYKFNPGQPDHGQMISYQSKEI